MSELLLLSDYLQHLIASRHYRLTMALQRTAADRCLGARSLSAAFKHLCANTRTAWIVFSLARPSVQQGVVTGQLTPLDTRHQHASLALALSLTSHV